MAKHEPDSRLTEPALVHCHFVTGGSFDVTPNVLRFVGWVLLPPVGGESTENRIVVRYAVPIDAARELHHEMGRALLGWT